MRWCSPYLLGSILAAGGCAIGPGTPQGSGPAPVPQQQVVLANPTVVPAVDREYAWNQIVDVVDDYFKIEREVRPPAGRTRVPPSRKRPALLDGVSKAPYAPRAAGT